MSDQGFPYDKRPSRHVMTVRRKQQGWGRETTREKPQI